LACPLFERAVAVLDRRDQHDHRRRAPGAGRRAIAPLAPDLALNLGRGRRDRRTGYRPPALDSLKLAAQRAENTMPATIEAVRAYATLGEICSALRDVYGIYEEPAI